MTNTHAYIHIYAGGGLCATRQVEGIWGQGLRITKELKIKKRQAIKMAYNQAGYGLQGTGTGTVTAVAVIVVAAAA